MPHRLPRLASGLMLAATLGAAQAGPAATAPAADTTAGTVADPAAAADAGVQALRCVDFLPLPDNFPLPESFKRSKFGFRDRAGALAPFVNVFADIIGQPVHGMQFDTRGLRITPPKPALTAELRLGGFHAPGLTLQAFDAAGVLQDAAVIPSDSLMRTVLLTAGTAPITLIVVQGGGDEGVVNRVCTTP